MYRYTRQEAAERLNVSTRSIDRYIRSGKLRGKKEGKIIYIHEQDVENLSHDTSQNQPEVIIQEKKSNPHSRTETSYTSAQEYDPLNEFRIQEYPNSQSGLERIYTDLRNEIQKKDTAIQELSIKLWQAQEIAKNSVSLVEFKKSQFLLEESKWHLSQELSGLRERGKQLEQKLKYEKSTNYILISFCVVLVLAIGIVWFLKI